MRLKVLLTGATSSVGCEIVRTLYPVCDLAGHYHSSGQVARDLQMQFPGVPFFQADLREDRQAGKLMEQAVDRLGGLDVVIHTVGPYARKSILELTPQEWDSTLQMNLNSAFRTFYYALPYLKNSTLRTQMVFFAFAGVEQLRARTMSADYCAAKAGLGILVKSLAVSLAPEIRVNAIAPGIVREPHLAHDSGRNERILNAPFQRAAEPAEIAETVRWLIQDSPPYISGAIIPVSGAWEY